MRSKVYQRPNLSIVTVTWNDEVGLTKTLESVAPMLDQGDAIEHIIVDGASAYNVKDLSSRLSPSSIIISEKDDGIYDAMNKGLTLAKGKYFIFLNSGDVLFHKNPLEICDLQSEMYDLIYGDAYELRKGKTVFKPANHHLSVRGGMFTHHQAMIFKRDFVVQRGISHDSTLKIAGDWDFVIKVISHKPQVLYVPVPICIFDEGGVSQSQIATSRREVFQIRKKHFGWKSAVMRRLLQDAVRLLSNISPSTYRWIRRVYVQMIHRVNK